MNKSLSRLLCLALCAVLLCGLLPATAVSAAELPEAAETAPAEPAADETSAVEETTAETEAEEAAAPEQTTAKTKTEEPSVPEEAGSESAVTVAEAPAEESPEAEPQAPAANAPTDGVFAATEDGLVITVDEALTAEPANDVSELPQLAAPTNLEWGIQRDNYGLNESTGNYEPMDYPAPGTMSWKPAEPTQGVASVNVYKVGEEGAVYSVDHYFGSTYFPEWRSVETFIASDPDSGTYYFTVKSVGDGVNYRDSETVTSATWTYTKPSAQLGQCANLSWNEFVPSFTLPNNGANAGGYETDILYAATAEDEPHRIGGCLSYHPDDYSGTITGWMPDSYVQKNGNGYYYFRVRALSADLNSICNGAWSELSPAYNLTEVSQSVESQLGTIVTESSDLSDEEIRDAVQSMDTEELKSAMLADTDDTGVIADLAALEQQVGGAAGVTVTEGASAFDASQISIVGANLNNAESASEPITLVVDKPEKDHVLDASYNNAVAVKFSMDLNNVQNTENLDVPVKITLPIPKDIKPDFLVILHYHMDGSVEELRMPYIFQVGEQFYASFVLTSFSDFTITEWVRETIPMYRLYNPNTGEHFYTGSVIERNKLDKAGWNYEGVAWNAPIYSGAPVYRMCSPSTGDHHYTMSTEERDYLQSVGWNYEGVAWNSADHTPENVPQYRLYLEGAEIGSHHYTSSEEERDNLVAQGWKFEGIAWYGTLK